MKVKLIVVALFFAGCAVNSGVVPIGQDTFMVSRQAATGFSGLGNLKAEAVREANQYCANQGKVLQVIHTSESSLPYIWGNFPKAEVQFMCLDPNDSELARPKLRKEVASTGIAARLRVTSEPTSTDVQRFAVIIGISSYQDTRIPALRYASDDAQAFKDWVISPNGGRYAPSRVKLLLDCDATCANIKEALFVWLKQALAEDMVTIYFAGHGSPESPDSPQNMFLLPYDARYNSIATTGFPMWDIETALKRYIKAKKVVVIADACHSGGVGQSFDIARRASRSLKVNPISTGIQGLSKVGDGVCVISASDEKQFSQESQNWGGGHGVFTYFLLKGLKGDADYNKDTSVNLGELTTYLSQEVRRATKNAQSPTVAGRYDPALTIGK